MTRTSPFAAVRTRLLSRSLVLCALGLAALTLGTVACGAEPYPPGGCPDIALDCEPGSFADDTDGDGCVDSCVPEVNCLALPSCDAGDTQVDDQSGCLQDDARCYEVAMCGMEIWCTGPDVVTCLQDDECGSGQRCDTENFCESACGGTAGPDADCIAVCMGRCVAGS